MRACQEFSGVYLHREPVDMRKGINGLCDVVASAAMGELQGKNLFVFTGRRRDLMKILYFDETGYAVWMKRLERDRFPWPRKFPYDVVTITAEQLDWLLQGYDVWRLKAFEKVSFARVA